MKYFKPFLMLLVVGLFAINSAYAALPNKHNMLPNNIPESIQFNLAQNGGNTAEIYFQKTSLPAHFICYFAPPNNKAYKGLTASISSDTANVIFQAGTDPLLVGGGTDVQMFTVDSSIGKGNVGNIVITLDGKANIEIATIVCAMQKINASR